MVIITCNNTIRKSSINLYLFYFAQEKDIIYYYSKNLQKSSTLYLTYISLRVYHYYGTSRKVGEKEM